MFSPYRSVNTLLLGYKKNSHLMLYREIIAVCSEVRIQQASTLCGQDVECFIVKPGGTYNNHLALKVTNRIPQQILCELFFS